MMDEIFDSPLGKKTAYKDQYDPIVLYSVNRDKDRIAIGIDVQDLPFQGVDIYNFFDFTWLNSKDIPEYGMLSLYVSCESPNLIEAKSLKLFLLSFANSQFQSISDILTTLEQDLANAFGTKIRVNLANVLSDFMHIEPRFPGTNLDNLAIKCSDKQINPSVLKSDPAQIASEQLCTDLLNFGCPVTNKPNWGSVRVTYTGSKIDQSALLQYIVSYRNYKGLQEQCIERIYNDILKHCKPEKLTVEGRYSRRGGLDINPVRTNVEYNQPNIRLFRQ